MTETRAEQGSQLQIKKATTEDVATVWGIVEADAKWLANQGLEHWAKYYTEIMVSKMIHKKEVFLGLKSGKAVGTITYDTKPPKYYDEEGYSKLFSGGEEENAAYVTAVAVLPNEQKQGFAGQMLQFAEEEAKQKGTKWMRLDCRAEVPDLVSFYEKRGYKKLGDKPIDEGEAGTYWLMEKELV